MIRQLDEHHRQIRAGIDEIRQHCDRVVPDISGLASARYRLSQASTVRSRYVHDVLAPALRQQASGRQLDQLRTMQHNFFNKRLVSSQHVTQWTSATIAADWNGYRAAARLIWKMMEEQMEQERSVFATLPPSAVAD